MKITVVSFQKNRDRDLERAEQTYVKRLTRYASVELRPLARWDEGTKLPEQLLRSAWCIGLFVDGKSWTSEGMAARIQALLNQGQSHLVWVIGAAGGMPSAAAGQVQERWSLSSLTFGHHLARLVLLEALYRSFDLLHGGRYHK